MKVRISIAFLCVALATSPLAQSAIVSMVSKKPDAKNTVVYIYNYTCVNGGRGTLNVWAVNDAEAQKQAEIQARIVCEET